MAEYVKAQYLLNGLTQDEIAKMNIHDNREISLKINSDSKCSVVIGTIRDPSGLDQNIASALIIDDSEKDAIGMDTGVARACFHAERTMINSPTGEFDFADVGAKFDSLVQAYQKSMEEKPDLGDLSEEDELDFDNPATRADLEGSANLKNSGFFSNRTASAGGVLQSRKSAPSSPESSDSEDENDDTPGLR